MKHKKIKSLLGAYYDGELKDKERFIIEEHLKECVECRSELNLIKEIGSLSLEPAHEPGENYWNSFAGRVQRRISEREKKEIKKADFSLLLRPNFIRLTATLTSIILIAILGIFYLESLKSPEKKALNQKESIQAESILEKDKKRVLKPEETLVQRPEEEKKIQQPSKSENRELIARKLEKKERVEEVKKVEKVEKGESSEKEAILFTESKEEKLSEVAEEEIYQRGLRFQEEGKYSEALENYNRIIYNYPSGKRAPQAQFQINKISSSQLDKTNEESYLRKKIKSWEDFIKKYPGSELVPSAKMNLADSYYQLAILTKDKKDIEGATMAIEDFLKVCSDDKDKGKFEKMLKEIKEIR
jgi:TolA-binding protein